MLKKIFTAYFKLSGWTHKDIVPVEDFKQSVVLAVPHTSNWDAVIMFGTFDLLKINARFTIKKSWMKFPLGLITKPLGGISIDRRPKKDGEKRESAVDAMVRLFKENEDLVLLITPEGTRSKREEWKTGFYHIAKGANVPIALSYIDFKNKESGVGKLIYPSDDMEKDMREIMAFYKNSNPKHPENFSVDLRYV